MYTTIITLSYSSFWRFLLSLYAVWWLVIQIKLRGHFKTNGRRYKSSTVHTWIFVKDVFFNIYKPISSFVESVSLLRQKKKTLLSDYFFFLKLNQHTLQTILTATRFATSKIRETFLVRNGYSQNIPRRLVGQKPRNTKLAENLANANYCHEQQQQSSSSSSSSY